MRSTGFNANRWQAPSTAAASIAEALNPYEHDNDDPENIEHRVRTFQAGVVLIQAVELDLRGLSAELKPYYE